MTYSAVRGCQCDSFVTNSRLEISNLDEVIDSVVSVDNEGLGMRLGGADVRS